MDEKIARKIMRNIATAYRCLVYIRGLQFKKYEINRGQHPFLTRIVDNPGISQEELSNLLKIDKTTTAKALKKLQVNRFITRERSDEDRRKWELYPTDKLLEVFPYIEKTIEDTALKGLKSFTDEEVEILLNLVEKLADNINDEWEKVKAELK